MKFYIAARLENHGQVSRIARALTAAGHEHTYDWTTHCSVKEEDKERLNEVSYNEYMGVKEANVFIAILPGGRGTHVELGMAEALQKHIILCSPSDAPFQFDDNPCAFYWGSKIKHSVGDEMKWLADILEFGRMY